MKIMFSKYDQDNTLSREEKLKAKIAFRDANPIFEAPASLRKPPKPEFPHEYMQTHLGQLAVGDMPTDDRKGADKYAAEHFGPDFYKMPEVMEQIDKRYPKEQEQSQGQSGNVIGKISSLLTDLYAFPLVANKEAGQAIYQGIKGKKGQTSQKIATPKTQQEYDALPSGTEYIQPETGQHKRKK
jgi:hypothetical protein